MRPIQSVLLSLLAGSVVVAAILCGGAHTPLSVPGGGRLAFGAGAAVAAYFAVVLLAHRLVGSRDACRLGALAGALGGVVQVAQLSLESFGSHLGDRAGVTLLFMGLTFALWGAVGFWVGFHTGQARPAIATAAWSAVVTMIVAVAYGLGLSAAGYPDAAYIATWPEFQHSGASDPQAFAIANAFSAALSHFLAGPLLGALLGALGLAAAAPFRARRIASGHLLED